MNILKIVILVVALSVGASTACAQKSTKNIESAININAVGPEHKKLQSLVGTWKTTAELRQEPGQAPITIQGTAEIRALGDLWITSELTGELDDHAYAGSLTFGYDPRQKAFVGTFIGDQCNHLWVYSGHMNEAGTILTFETEGPTHDDPARMSRLKDVYELKNEDHKVVNSYIEGTDGKWELYSTMDFRRE